MPTYVYEYQDTGDRVEKFQLMRDEPLTEIEGRAVARVPCVPELAGVDRKVWGYPYVSNRLPSTIKGCKLVNQGGRMKPLIESERHERKVAAMNDLTKDAASNEMD